MAIRNSRGNGNDEYLNTYVELMKKEGRNGASILPYKSITVVCDKDVYNDVRYWLDYCHGGGISKTKELPNGKIAIRSNYMCW